MRVTAQMRRSQLMQDLERLQSDLYKSQNVLSDGREVSKGSDDPVRAKRALLIRSSLARREQYMENLTYGMSRISATEASLMNVDDVLSESRAFAVHMANDPSVPEERAATAESVNVLLEELVSEANERHNSGYIFGGFNTESQPYEVIRDPDTDEITAVIPQSEFMDGVITVKADEDLEIQVNMNGSEMFQTGTPGGSGDMFQALIDFRDALRWDDVEAASEEFERIIDELDDSLSLVQVGMSSLGGRYNRLQSVEQSHMSLEIRETEDLSITEDGELTDWITKFELQTIALQQALSIGTQVLNASFLSFMS